MLLFLQEAAMSNNQIVLCMQQKLILITSILNITKQIEVRCSQPEIELGNLLQKRQLFMGRIDKCNALISKLTDELPPKEKERMQQLLSGKAEETSCNEDELIILQSSQKFKDYLEQSIVLDTNATQSMRKQYDKMKITINKQRKAQGNKSIYNIR